MLVRWIKRLMVFILSITIVGQGLAFADDDMAARYMVKYAIAGPRDVVLKGKWPTDGEIVINDAVSVVYDTHANIILRFSDRVLKHVEVDGKIELLQQQSTQQIADLLREKLTERAVNATDNIKIALLDSGVDKAQNIDLAGGVSFVPGSAYDCDDNGHGSEIASLIKGFQTEAGDQFSGLAPQAELYSVKIFNRFGSGHYSDLIRALDWSYNNQIDVIIMAGDAKSYSAILKGSFDRVEMKNISLLSLGDLTAVVEAPDEGVAAIPQVDTVRLSEQQQRANAVYIYHKLIERGWTKQAIAGLLGNIQRESQLNPAVWQMQNNAKLGYGLVQWDDGADFLDWQGGAVKNRPLSAIEVNQLAVDDAAQLIDMELEFLMWTSRTQTDKTERRWFATNRYRSPYKMSYEDYIKSEAAVADLALVFHASYERSSDCMSQLNDRIAYSEKWYNFLSSK